MPMPWRLASGGPVAAKMAGATGGGEVERVGGDFVGLAGDDDGDLGDVAVMGLVGGERGRNVWVVAVVLVVVLMVMGLVAVVAVGAVEEAVVVEAILLIWGCWLVGVEVGFEKVSVVVVFLVWM